MIATDEQPKATVNYREVRHCPVCGDPIIAAPVLECAHCGKKIMLRCFVYSPEAGKYIAECIDLDILSQGKTLEEAIGKLQEAVFSYLEAAFDGGSTRGLVLRLSPLSHRIRYHFHKLICRVRYPFGRNHVVQVSKDCFNLYLSHS